MRVYKEKQCLVFDYEDGRTVKYDFALKKAIGVKGKPVKSLQSQLSGMSMKQLMDCCDDKNYAKFLDFVREEYPYYIDNIGTILSKVPNYANFEQIFSAGLGDIVHHNFKGTISDIPKSLIKIAKDKKIKITNELCKYWRHNPNAHCLAYKLNYISLTDKNIYQILSCSDSTYDRGFVSYFSYFNNLIDEYGYEAKTLLLYLDTLKTFEALDDIPYVLRELKDYARMMNTISFRFDKYPRNFLTTHKIACRNYNRLIKEFPEDIFKQRINKDYECVFGDYIFIYPDSTQDIKDEAINQHHCVASYIDDVINGNCHIMFLRKKTTPRESLVTVEVRNNQIVQARRKYNADITEEDAAAIDKWNKRFAKYQGK